MLRNNCKTVHLFTCMLLFFSKGCIVPESNHVAPDFYLLTDLPLPDTQIVEDEKFTFYLREIEIPKYLKDPRMVVRPTQHTIKFRESKRWGEPLQDGIARVVGLNIQNQFIHSQSSIFPNRRKEALAWDISISFSVFEVISENIVVEAKWVAKKAGADSVTGSFSSKLPLDASASEEIEVLAFNEALFDLSKKFIDSVLQR